MAVNGTQSVTESTIDRNYSKAEIDRLLRITPALIADASGMHASGESVDAIIWYLKRKNVTKPGVHSILRRANVLPSSEIKEVVHFHPAFEYRRASDERFQEQAIAALEQIDAEENQAAA